MALPIPAPRPAPVPVPRPPQLPPQPPAPPWSRMRMRVRWEPGQVPPLGCRYCGISRSHHGSRARNGSPEILLWTKGRGAHRWARPTDRQIRARRAARMGQPPTHFVGQDPKAGLRHGGIRWPDGSPPTPYGCRFCGEPYGSHGGNCAGAGRQGWHEPTSAQILARMLARRRAQGRCCCGLGRTTEDDMYRCEADDCVAHDYLAHGGALMNAFDGRFSTLRGGAR